jgi:hypothetical protein
MFEAQFAITKGQDSAMPIQGHNPQAFDNWYQEIGEEGLAEYEAAILRSDEISTFRLAATNSLVSDDSVADIDLWLSLRGGSSESIDWGTSR